MGIGSIGLNRLSGGYCLVASRSANRTTLISYASTSRGVLSFVNGTGLGCVLLARNRFSRVNNIPRVGRGFNTGIIVDRTSSRVLSSNGTDLTTFYKVGRRGADTSVLITRNSRVVLNGAGVSIVTAPNRAGNNIYCLTSSYVFANSALFFYSYKHASFPNNSTGRVVRDLGHLSTLSSTLGICPNRSQFSAVNFRGRGGPCVEWGCSDYYWGPSLFL